MNTNEHETVAPLSEARLIVYLVVAVGFFVGSCVTALSQTTNNFFQFVQEQSERHYTNVPHEVLAVYYGWYGNPGRGGFEKPNLEKREIANSGRYPVKGPYSSHDVAVLEWQIDQAKEHGITGFVVSWFGQGEWNSWYDESLALLLEIAEKKDFKITFYWENQRDTGDYIIPFAVSDLVYALTQHGKKKAFLKLNGKPVFFAQERINAQTPLTSLAEIFQETRRKAGDFVVIGQWYQSGLAYIFDGLHTDYVPNMALHLLAKPDPEKLREFRELAGRYFTRGAQLARQRSRIVCPMIIPGFDNTKARAAFSETGVKAERFDGQTYRASWEEALKTKPDWILISSWNEWPEGTEIEPSVELGDKYLKITAEYAKPFLKSPVVDVPAPVDAPPKFAPTAQREFDKLLAGRTIGILAQDIRFDAEFWASYCGAKVQRLTWTNLIDPTNFNAKNFPILIHVAGDDYPSKVKSPGDVKRALVRYLQQGGFLVSLPFATWPLLYDSTQGGKPIALTDDLHLRIDSWPGFPAPAELKFLINTNVLPGLPTTIPFPTTGDLRWTGASLKRGSQYDNYVPLVQLRDTKNRYFGEGAVYIEHKTLPVSPGKSIYVWMRTAEAIGEDKFYPALFEFISTKLSTNAKPRSVSNTKPQK